MVQKVSKPSERNIFGRFVCLVSLLHYASSPFKFINNLNSIRVRSCTLAQLHICTVASCTFVQFTFAQLHICTVASCTFAQFTFAQLRICTVAQFTFAQLRICTVAHLHCCAFAQLRICTVARLHSCAFAQLHICTVHICTVHICTVHICTVAHLHSCTVHSCAFAQLHICTVPVIGHRPHPTFYSAPLLHGTNMTDLCLFGNGNLTSSVER